MPDRLITIKLPETVNLGIHSLVVVMDEGYSGIANTNDKQIMQFSGAIAAFSQVDGVEYQKKVRAEWE